MIWESTVRSSISYSIKPLQISEDILENYISIETTNQEVMLFLLLCTSENLKTVLGSLKSTMPWYLFVPFVLLLNRVKPQGTLFPLSLFTSLGYKCI